MEWKLEMEREHTLQMEFEAEFFSIRLKGSIIYLTWHMELNLGYSILITHGYSAALISWETVTVALIVSKSDNLKPCLYLKVTFRQIQGTSPHGPPVFMHSPGIHL